MKLRKHRQSVRLDPNSLHTLLKLFEIMYGTVESQEVYEIRFGFLNYLGLGGCSPPEAFYNPGMNKINKIN